MNKSKQLKFISLILALVLAVAGLVAVIVVFVVKQNDFGEEINVKPLVVDCEPYTNSDNLITDSAKTINDYNAENNPLHLTKAKVALKQNSKHKLEISGSEDDYIVQIVPKYLFATVGEKFHLGTEYGFYIKTEKKYTHYFSTVLVFDVTLETEGIGDRVITSVKPLFEYNYIYISAERNCINYVQNSVKQKIDYKIENDLVVAVPSSAKYNWTIKLNYDIVNKYTIKDVGFSLELLNEQELNIGDIGYDAYKDDGSFFNEVTYKFKNKKVNVADYYNSRLTQLQHYRDENGNPTLIKKTAIPHNILETTNPKDILIGSNNYPNNITADFATGEFGYIHSSFGVSANLTRVIANFELKVIETETSKQVGTGSTQLIKYAYNPVYKNTDTVNYFDVNLLPNGTNYFTFNQTYDSDYVLELSNSENLTLKLNDNIVSLNSGKANLFIPAGEHKIVVRNNGDTKVFSKLKIRYLSMQASENNKQLTVNANSKYLLKIDSLDGIKEINTNNPNVVINKVYNDNKINSYYCDTNNKLIVEENKLKEYSSFGNNCLISELFKNDSYFIELINNSNQSQNVNLVITEPTQTVTTNVDFDIDLIKGSYKYVKFVPDSSGTYIIKSKIDANNHISVYNKNYRRYIGEFSDLGYTAGLTKGEVYYIGVKSSDVEKQIINIEEQEYSTEIIASNGTNTISTFSHSLYLEKEITYSLSFKVNGVLLDINEIIVSYDQHFAKNYKFDYDFEKNTIKFDLDSSIGGSGFPLDIIDKNTGVYYLKCWLKPKMNADIEINKVENVNNDIAVTLAVPKFVSKIEYELTPGGERFIYKMDLDNVLNNSSNVTISLLNNIKNLGLKNLDDVKFKITGYCYLDIFKDEHYIEKLIESSVSIANN